MEEVENTGKKGAGMHHEIKCEREYFREIMSGRKKFELRKNDRDYKVGDTFCLIEVIAGVPTGYVTTRFEIQYILYGPKYGLPEGHCIFNW